MYEHKKWDIALILKQLNRMEVCPFAAFLHMIYLTTIFHTLNISDVTNVPQQNLDRFPSAHIEVTILPPNALRRDYNGKRIE